MNSVKLRFAIAIVGIVACDTAQPVIDAGLDSSASIDASDASTQPDDAPEADAAPDQDVIARVDGDAAPDAISDATSERRDTSWLPPAVPCFDGGADASVGSLDLVYRRADSGLIRVCFPIQSGSATQVPSRCGVLNGGFSGGVSGERIAVDFYDAPAESIGRGGPFGTYSELRWITRDAPWCGTGNVCDSRGLRCPSLSVTSPRTTVDGPVEVALSDRCVLDGPNYANGPMIDTPVPGGGPLVVEYLRATVVLPQRLSDAGTPFCDGG